MTSITEQADAIVGISEILGPRGFLAHASDAEKRIHRRGAYIDWFIHYPARSIHEMRVPSIAHNTIEDLAAEIVRLHKPKGDGLPEIESWSHGPRGFGFNTHAHETDNERLGQLIFDCFKSSDSPVRRLLAMYDVVEKNPNRDAVHIPHVVVEHGATAWNTQPDICWLVPRGER